MALHKDHENSPLAISKAIKSINANYKMVKMVLKLKSFGKCLEPMILGRILLPFRKRKAALLENKIII
jgi:hypothetical protein